MCPSLLKEILLLQKSIRELKVHENFGSYPLGSLHYKISTAWGFKMILYYQATYFISILNALRSEACPKWRFFWKIKKNLQNPLTCTEKPYTQNVAVDSGSELAILIFFVAWLFIAKQVRVLESNKKVTQICSFYCNYS